MASPEQRKATITPQRCATVAAGSSPPGTGGTPGDMGHDSPRAALIYQHANRVADHGIADAIDKAVKATRRKPSKRKLKGAPRATDRPPRRAKGTPACFSS